MVGKAIPVDIKKRRKVQEQEDKLLAAAAEVIEEHDKPKAKHCSIRSIATIYEVSSSTLSRHVNGGCSAKNFNVLRQKLSTAEEDVLVKIICELADQGFPASCQRVTDMAESILKS
ncbi:hypothetical protein M422DRAFT_48121 [Sphaerobolus stellatus SS14]|uniref:HTH psq-type domain-containing protein n=1 Tax=Sphaerobolus stellatus (strain SS14) TaxID=990650 RepID=A0A0C9VWI5_SPHS4|nr:hypothetical protein M422DRAFT_48121 [Sphaerobolus stellatus SS14]